MKRAKLSRKKWVADVLSRNSRLNLMLEIKGDIMILSDDDGEDPCPCDGDVTLVTPNGGCEWGSEECPSNTVAPPDPDDPKKDGPNSLSARKGGTSPVKFRLKGPRRDLAAKLLGDLVE